MILELSRRDWIFQVLITLYPHFRSRTFQFEDFIIAWSDRLKAQGEHTVLTAKIQKDIDKFQVCN